jgi:EmrB/QacA subfamily drug resistance transporter
MAPVDGSAVNIIIPVIQQDFHVAHLGKVAWVQLAYLIVIGGLILPMGRLGDLWGFRRIYLFGAGVFTVSSALCGLAPSLGWLIGARVLQGVGACMMMALSSGIITAIFPAEERGRALGVVGMCIAVGLVIGPTFGGFLAHLRGSWRWVFFINLPVGLFGGLWCARMLPPLRFGRPARADWPGGLLAVTMLTALLLAITNGSPWGWRSPAVLALLALSLTSAIAFIGRERRCATPMLDLSLFRNRVFAGANLASMMNFLGQSCAVFLTPVLLENGFGYNTAKAGMIIAAVPVGVMLLAPISGSLSDRIGTRGLAAAGESVVAVGLAGMAVLLHGICAGSIAQERALPIVVCMMLLVGLGTGLFQSPNNSAVMGSVPRTHLGVGGGVLATMRNLGMAFGIAVSSAVAGIEIQSGVPAAARLENLKIFHDVGAGFAVGAFFVFLGALTSLVREDQAVSARAETRA